MKQTVKFALLVLALCISFSSCTYEEEKVADAVITDCYINNLGHKVFIMSDSCMAEIVLDGESRYVQFYDGAYNIIGHNEDNIFTRWLNAEIGYQTVKTKCSLNSRISYYYDIVIPSNYSVKRKVTRVTKYDGNLNKINGDINLRAHLLSGSSGTGGLKGEEMGGQNMFINIYFEDRSPISVNAKENQLWLDVEVGDTIIEKRINGKVIFNPF